MATFEMAWAEITRLATELENAKFRLQIIANQLHPGVELREITTPVAVAGRGRIYTKTDDTLYFQDGAGVEHALISDLSLVILQAILTTRGDIIWRGSSEAERLAGSWGNGYNVLHMKSVGGQLEPEWWDVRDLIIYLTGALNRVINPPTLGIPAPTIGIATAEDHSGGAFTAPESLTIPAPTIGATAELV